MQPHFLQREGKRVQEKDSFRSAERSLLSAKVHKNIRVMVFFRFFILRLPPCNLSGNVPEGADETGLQPSRP
ncbi:hypothetical protein HMPREF9141_0731 [Prevotella multiformis DSM 16608]|uniref:Uncharacterized protein n=1 Tax=Prevotella multiformis DSM 16608 TaxID=888743 RepID=F0F565_9BACT|nr:hypothetical protein HMPREF9141_0731 [Prevotella multiformis DSM 16608]